MWPRRFPDGQTALPSVYSGGYMDKEKEEKNQNKEFINSLVRDNPVTKAFQKLNREDDQLGRRAMTVSYEE